MLPNTIPNDPENMPTSSAPTADLTDNVLGDANKADLDKGFCTLPEPTGEDMTPDYLFGVAPGGFVGRAKGWER
jgi:hypothetical protein